MTIQELDTYYESLYKKFKSGNPDFELNHDRAHNTTIERFMLDNSLVINMYCGEMSVFRNNFYEYINKDNPSESEESEKLGDILKKKLIESLERFIKKQDTQLCIFLEKFDESYFRDLIDRDIFTNGVHLGKIKFFKLDDELLLKKGLSHVSYTDSNIVRMEKNQSTHEATCAINTPMEIMDIWINSFNSIRSVAQPISYPN